MCHNLNSPSEPTEIVGSARYLLGVSLWTEKEAYSQWVVSHMMPTWASPCPLSRKLKHSWLEEGFIFGGNGWISCCSLFSRWLGLLWEEHAHGYHFLTHWHNHCISAVSFTSEKPKQTWRVNSWRLYANHSPYSCTSPFLKGDPSGTS